MSSIEGVPLSVSCYGSGLGGLSCPQIDAKRLAGPAPAAKHRRVHAVEVWDISLNTPELLAAVPQPPEKRHQIRRIVEVPTGRTLRFGLDP